MARSLTLALGSEQAPLKNGFIYPKLIFHWAAHDIIIFFYQLYNAFFPPLLLPPA
jgi:hypothetical protein